MIRPDFLDGAAREDLTALVRGGKAESRVTRRANALLLLDKGWSCELVAEALFMDAGTLRYWHWLYQEKGLTWLAGFGYKGRACELTAVQPDALKQWVSKTFASPNNGGRRMDRNNLRCQHHALSDHQITEAALHGISQAQAGS